jgi:Uma2 family endonuclease
LVTAGFNHRIVAGNLNRHFGRLLKGRGNVGSADLRLKVEATGLLTYPDLFVTRGALTMVEEPAAALVNPSLLAEVTATETELYDRTTKFAHYRRIPTLSAYLLVSPDVPRVEQFNRETDSKWLYTWAAGPHATLELPSFQVTISLAEIYAGVEFPDREAFLRPTRN